MYLTIVEAELITPRVDNSKFCVTIPVISFIWFNFPTIWHMIMGKFFDIYYNTVFFISVKFSYTFFVHSKLFLDMHEF